jgi:KDO2-lipid IV(A) lauroyltransferase
MKNILHLLVTGVFIFFLIMIGILPFFLLYWFSDLMYFLPFNLIGFRKNVILKNLHDTFPNKTESEIQMMMRKTYRNLVDVIVEGIKAFTITRKQVLKRHKLVNPELAEAYLEKGRSIIIVTGHYANWEWGSLSASAFRNRQVIIFYKALSNPWIDRFVRWNRGRYGAKLASVKETTLTFDRYGKLPAIFLMAADQNPHRLKDCYWIDFLGRDTVFLYGPEKHARRSQCPVIYAEVQRERGGYYTVTLSLLAEDVKLLSDGELTMKYARKLESVILHKPEDWLWSHRRWKHKRPAVLSHSRIPL